MTTTTVIVTVAGNVVIRGGSITTTTVTTTITAPIDQSTPRVEEHAKPDKRHVLHNLSKRFARIRRVITAPVIIAIPASVPTTASIHHLRQILLDQSIPDRFPNHP